MFGLEREGTGPGIPIYLRLTNRPIVPRTMVVGDIHGVPEFFDLLKIMEFQPGKDLLVAVGDLVDRGPASWEVVRFFRETSGVYSVLGNHERRLVGHARGTIPGAWSQIQTLAQHPGPDLEGDLRWLESLCAVVETPHAIVVHARLDPSKDIWDQDPYHTCAVGGPSVQIELDQDEVPLWFHEWVHTRGGEKPICYGHLGFSRVEVAPGRLYALDTDAAQGGCLTALILPEGRLVSIPCRNHFLEARAQWTTSRANFDPMHAVSIERIFLPDNVALDANEGSEIEKARTRFHHLVEDLDVLRSEISRAFGLLPPPGASRGRYLKKVRSEWPKGVHPSVARWLLSTPLDRREAPDHFGRMTLETLDFSIQSISTWVRIIQHQKEGL